MPVTALRCAGLVLLAFVVGEQLYPVLSQTPSLQVYAWHK